MGIILVFDLDQTIAHSEEDEKVIINNNIIKLFKYIYRNGSRSPAVDRIYLLTNNSNKDYIKFIDNWLKDNIPARGSFTGDTLTGLNNSSEYYEIDDYFFDYILDYDHYSREGKGIKGLKDIKFMLNIFGGYPDNDQELVSRTFFFDDLPTHAIKKEMKTLGYENHYIQITPPFKGVELDRTDYSLVYLTIQEMEDALDKEANNDMNFLGGKRLYYKKHKSLRHKKGKSLKKRRV